MTSKNSVAMQYWLTSLGGELSTLGCGQGFAIGVEKVNFSLLCDSAAVEELWPPVPCDIDFTGGVTEGFSGALACVDKHVTDEDLTVGLEELPNSNLGMLPTFSVISVCKFGTSYEMKSTFANIIYRQRCIKIYFLQSNIGISILA